MLTTKSTKQFSFLTQKRRLSKQVRRKKHSPAACVFYISLMLSNTRHVLSQFNTRLRLLYFSSVARKCYYVWSIADRSNFMSDCKQLQVRLKSGQHINLKRKKYQANMLLNMFELCGSKLQKIQCKTVSLKFRFYVMFMVLIQ